MNTQFKKLIATLLIGAQITSGYAGLEAFLEAPIGKKGARLWTTQQIEKFTYRDTAGVWVQCTINNGLGQEQLGNTNGLQAYSYRIPHLNPNNVRSCSILFDQNSNPLPQGGGISPNGHRLSGIAFNSDTIDQLRAPLYHAPMNLTYNPGLNNGTVTVTFVGIQGNNPLQVDTTHNGVVGMQPGTLIVPSGTIKKAGNDGTRILNSAIYMTNGGVPEALPNINLHITNGNRDPIRNHLQQAIGGEAVGYPIFMGTNENDGLGAENIDTLPTNITLSQIALHANRGIFEKHVGKILVSKMWLNQTLIAHILNNTQVQDRPINNQHQGGNHDGHEQIQCITDANLLVPCQGKEGQQQPPQQKPQQPQQQIKIPNIKSKENDLLDHLLKEQKQSQSQSSTASRVNPLACLITGKFNPPKES